MRLGSPMTRVSRGRVHLLIATSIVLLASLAVAADVSIARGAERTPGEKLSFDLEHSLDGKTFTPTGVVVGRLAVDRSDARNFRLSSPKAERSALSADEAAALNALAAAGGTYRVRAPSDFANPGSGRVMASVSAACLVNGGLEDVLTVHADDQGRAYGIEYASAREGCGSAAGDGKATRRVSEGATFRTTVNVRVGKDAPPLNPDAPTDVRGHGSPATEKAKREEQQRREAERARRQREANGDSTTPERKVPETFLQKHWMKLLMVSYSLAFLCAPQDVNTRAAAQRRLDAMQAKKRR